MFSGSLYTSTNNVMIVKHGGGSMVIWHIQEMGKAEKPLYHINLTSAAMKGEEVRQ